MIRSRIRALLLAANFMLFAAIIGSGPLAQQGPNLPTLTGCCRVDSLGYGVCCHPYSCNCDIHDVPCEFNWECEGWI